MEFDTHGVAFADVTLVPQASRTESVKNGEWSFSVSREADRLLLNAESGTRRVTQAIAPNSVRKRFVFDLKKHRFEPMLQEIRIEYKSEEDVLQIEKMSGVTAVKRYPHLGFAIVKVAVAINPVEVLRKLKSKDEYRNARILTGFNDYEPM